MSFAKIVVREIQSYRRFEVFQLLRERESPVREVFNNLVAWDGVVEVFDLVDHPKAKRCYAWSYQDGNKTRTVAVLDLPPVVSPETAVKVAIAAKARKASSAQAREEK
jgi:hypothetical protein